MKKPVEKAPNPFTSSTHETQVAKPLVTRDGLKAAARQTTGVIGRIHLFLHAVAISLFSLSIGARADGISDSRFALELGGRRNAGFRVGVMADALDDIWSQTHL